MWYQNWYQKKKENRKNKAAQRNMGQVPSVTNAERKEKKKKINRKRRGKG